MSIPVTNVDKLFVFLSEIYFFAKKLSSIIFLYIMLCVDLIMEKYFILKF